MTRHFLLRPTLVLCLLLPLGAAAQQPFSNIFVFGDSLSDAGNLAALPALGFLEEPPYDNGFSNGDRAVEVLASALGLQALPSLHLVGAAVGTNYAVAGARARGDTPVDLEAQMAAFLLNNGGVAPSDALYIVFIGANDVRDARDAPERAVALGIIRDALGTISLNIRTLAAAGASAIAVVNVPDIGLIPETRAPRNRRAAQRATALTIAFNRNLRARVRRIEGGLGLDLDYFNLFRRFRFIINHSIALGFTNYTGACFSSVTFTFYPRCAAGANLDRFVFFDEIHPTARTHALVGRALFAAVPKFVPVPP